MVQNVLNMFGDLIKYLKIVGNNLTNGLKVMKSVNDKTFDSLRALKLLGMKENLMRELKNSFKNVTSLSLDVFTSLGMKNEKLNRIFPNLEDLHMTNSKNVKDWLFINGQFRRMSKLEIDFLYEAIEPIEAIGIFFKNNEQIEDLKLHFLDQNILKLINETLPNVKVMEINQLASNYSSYEGDTIYLNSVKELKLKINVGHLEGIAFDQLEKLNIWTQSTENWKEFLQNQKNIKELTIATYQLTPDFFQIAHKLPHLQRIQIDINYSTKKSLVSVGNVVAFIQSCHNLNYFQIEIRMFDTGIKQIQKELSSDWIIDVDAVYEPPIMYDIKKPYKLIIKR